jgi:hypothetical protein
MHLHVIGAILLATAAGACSMDTENLGRMYVSPGRFEYYRCPEIWSQMEASSKREQEMAEAMDRANQAASGPLINALVYSSKLATAREELRQLHEVAVQKNCGERPTPRPSDIGLRR